MAVNCWVLPVCTEALAGETVIVVRTGEDAATAMLPSPVGPSQPTPAVQRTDGLQEPLLPDFTSKDGVPGAQAYAPAPDRP